MVLRSKFNFTRRLSHISSILIEWTRSPPHTLRDTCFHSYYITCHLSKNALHYFHVLHKIGHISDYVASPKIPSLKHGKSHFMPPSPDERHRRKWLIESLQVCVTLLVFSSSRALFSRHPQSNGREMCSDECIVSSIPSSSTRISLSMSSIVDLKLCICSLIFFIVCSTTSLLSETLSTLNSPPHTITILHFSFLNTVASWLVNGSCRKSVVTLIPDVASIS